MAAAPALDWRIYRALALGFLDGILRGLGAAGILPISSIQAGVLRYVFVGIALMLLVIFRPQGIFGNKRELTFVK